MTKMFLMISALAVITVGMIVAQPTGTPSLPGVPTNGGTGVSAPTPQLMTVVSDPQWVATSPVNQDFVVNFRALLSNGQSTTDFTTVPVGIQGYTNDGVPLAGMLNCSLTTAQCTVRSSQPRTIYLYAAMPGMGLGYASLAINIYRPSQTYLPTIDVTSSQGQANDGTTPVLTATSPITFTSPVLVSVNSQYDNGVAPVTKSLYFPNGVTQGQRIPIYSQEVIPLTFDSQRYFQVQMVDNNNALLAQGFGSTVNSMQLSQLGAQVDDSGNLVFTLNGPYAPSVMYNIVLLRGNRFRVELSQQRGELFAYPSGNSTKLVVQQGTLGGNRFDLQPGQYTVCVNALDTSNGISFSQSKADALSLDRNYILQ